MARLKTNESSMSARGEVTSARTIHHAVIQGPPESLEKLAQSTPPELLDKVTRVVSENLNVEKLTILDGGNGEGLPTYVKNLTNSAVVMLEQMKNATGIDLAKLAKGQQPGKVVDLPKERD